MYTDLAGFSRQVAEFGIIHFLQTIYESQKLFVPCIDHYDGILLKVEADSMLVIFRNVRKAIDCAVRMQQSVKAYNKDKEDTEKILLGVGLGFGQVLHIGDEDDFGAEDFRQQRTKHEDIGHVMDMHKVISALQRATGENRTGKQNE